MNHDLHAGVGARVTFDGLEYFSNGEEDLKIQRFSSPQAIFEKKASWVPIVVSSVP